MRIIQLNSTVDQVTCDIKLFADDTVLCTLVFDHKISSDLLNENLHYVNKWANQWLVNFNPDKTKNLYISLKRNSTADNHPLHFNNRPIKSVHSQRHLGIVLTNDLRWTKQIDRIIEGVARLHDLMVKLKYQIDRKSLENIILQLLDLN